MADSNASDGASPSNEQGVLANLPRTRPQRSTPRRAAARNGASTARTRSRGAGSRQTQAARGRETAGAKPSAPRQGTAPVQGFECDSEATTGSVQPPGAVELLASAAEIVSELTKAGVSRSERLIKDLVSRLPLN